MKTNESHMDLVPIHRKEHIDSIGAHYGPRQTRWTPEKLAEAILKMKQKCTPQHEHSTKPNYEDLYIEFEYDSGSDCNLPSLRLGLWGTRLETDKEFKDRMRHLISRAEVDISEAERNAKLTDFRKSQIANYKAALDGVQA